MKYSLSTGEIPRAEPKGFPKGSGFISPNIPTYPENNIRRHFWYSNFVIDEAEYCLHKDYKSRHCTPFYYTLLNLTVLHGNVLDSTALH